MKKNLFIFALAIIIFSCQNKDNNKTEKENSSKVQISVPLFSADSAYRYIEQQVEFGIRVPNTASHKKCGLFLEKKLKEFGAETSVQETKVTALDGKVLNIKNIIGSFNTEAKTRILLFAHWDTRPWADNDPDEANHQKPILGANDGASGVGVLLELARQLGKKSPRAGIDIIFFDAEDYGGNAQDSWCLGSQYWSKNKHKPNYHAKFGVLLDMVGAPNATFYRENLSEYFANHIVDKVWSEASQLGFSQYFINEKSTEILDDHYYINNLAGIPSIDIIQYNKYSKNGFGDYWHTLDDTMENIDKNTLYAVGTTVLNVIYKEVE